MRTIRLVAAAAITLTTLSAGIPAHADDPPIPAAWDGEHQACPTGVRAVVRQPLPFGPYIAYGPGAALLAQNDIVFADPVPGDGIPIYGWMVTQTTTPGVNRITATYFRDSSGYSEGQDLSSVGWSTNGGTAGWFSGATSLWDTERFTGTRPLVSIVCVEPGMANPPPD